MRQQRILLAFCRPVFTRKLLACRTIYNMCTQKPPNDYSEQLYTRYRESFSVYIKERVNVLLIINISQATLQLVLQGAHD